jgi:hypothetical protein
VWCRGRSARAACHHSPQSTACPPAPGAAVRVGAAVLEVGWGTASVRASPMLGLSVHPTVQGMTFFKKNSWSFIHWSWTWL